MNEREYLAECHRGGEMTSLGISLYTYKTDTALKALRSKYELLKYYADRYEEPISFVIGLSNVDLRRPREIIPYHLHAVIKGPGSFAFAHNVARRINRRANKDGNAHKLLPATVVSLKAVDPAFNDGGARYILKDLWPSCPFKSV